MKESRGFHHSKLIVLVFMVIVSLFPMNLKQSLSSPLNREGLALLMFRDKVERDPFGALSNWNGDDGVMDPCSWFGVECSDGKVVTLDLKDLCLQGTLAHEIGNLPHIKSIILRNNSLFGEIPKEILQLEELEVLDLGYNNFSGQFPLHIGSSNPSLTLTTLLLDNNDYLANLTPEVYELKMISEIHVNKEQLTGAIARAACLSRSSFCRIGKNEDIAQRRRLLHEAIAANTPRIKRDHDIENFTISPSPSPSSLPPNSQSSAPSGLLFSPSEPPSNSPSASAPSSFSPSSLSSPEVSPSPSPSSIFLSPSPSALLMVAPTPVISAPVNPPTVVSTPPLSNWVAAPSPALFSEQENTDSPKSKHQSVVIWSAVGGFSLLILVSAIAFGCFRNSNVVTVRPWATGLSGQLQKAFVTGLPNLKREEIEAACEDFSNIIGSLADGIVYKGTLSSGVEIAVASTAVTSYENWSKKMEREFRKKIETLSRVNHKNFVNLIGYCEEKKPFTRMMVFEYAPNGTLYEHLHIREAERLDWQMRKRIAMGIAYCLEHMHQLTPPIAHRNLLSSSIYLSEDYAAKISDLCFWNDIIAKNKDSAATKLLETLSTNTKANVYSFGLILLELITGRVPYTLDNDLLADSAAECLRREEPLRDVVDPTLDSLQAEEIEKWSEVIKDCVHPDPENRPTMKEVTARLKKITAMAPEGAIPKLSPLWWAELEILSTE